MDGVPPTAPVTTSKREPDSKEDHFHPRRTFVSGLFLRSRRGFAVGGWCSGTPLPSPHCAAQLSVGLPVELPRKTVFEEIVLLRKIKHLCDGYVAVGAV